MPSMATEELTIAKQRKLAEQKRVADEMNQILTKEGSGLIEVSRRTKRDLIVAIDVAKRPGYHPYYQPAEETQTVVRNGELKKLTKKVQRIQGEIDSLDQEIAQIDSSKERLKIEADAPQMTSISQWIARHGQPGPAPPNYLSTFEKAPKIYGGTNHHKAFKSQATIMRRGIMTR
mmetsp:Transcript_42568/g.86069  ORF Transcript_42568/g.86069 Transcript_42568/m.86069 type:complete len:175 (-) Transcript_42568:213-737(-)